MLNQDCSLVPGSCPRALAVSCSTGYEYFVQIAVARTGRSVAVLSEEGNGRRRGREAEARGRVVGWCAAHAKWSRAGIEPGVSKIECQKPGLPLGGRWLG